MVVVWEFNNVFFVLTHQSGRQNQEIGANGIECGKAPILGQAHAFEPVNQVGCKENRLEESDIGCPVFCRDFGQRIIVDQFADMFFDIGSERVETVDSPRAGFEVSDKNMVGIFFILKERELLGFGGIVRDGAPDNHETVKFVPLVMDFVPKLCHFPTIFQFLETARLGSGFDRRILFGYDDILAASSVEKCHRPFAVETRIHTESDAGSSNVFGDFGQTHDEKSN